jgi:predicted esterase
MKNLNINKKVIIGGYDWGGGISLSLCSKYPTLFSKIIEFMPSYSEPTGNELKCLPVPVLIIWIESDPFHIWSKWKNLAAKIPKKTIEIIKMKHLFFLAAYCDLL